MKSLLLVLVLLAAASVPLAAQDAPPSDAALARGSKVYVWQRCGKCHSLDGRDPKKRSLDGIGTRMTAEEIRLWIVDPVDMASKTEPPHKAAMKSYAKVAETDLAALVVFLAARTKPTP
jgi:mono/diheme cytochrome c family protein